MLINCLTISTKTKDTPGSPTRETRGNMLSSSTTHHHAKHKKTVISFAETVNRGSDWIRTNDTPGMNRML